MQFRWEASSLLRLTAGWILAIVVLVCLLVSTARGDSTTEEAQRNASGDGPYAFSSNDGRYGYLPWAVPCSSSIAEQVECPMSKPLCCTRTSAVRCCPLPSSKKNVSSFSTAMSPFSSPTNVTQLPELIQYFMITNACSASCVEEPVRGFEFTQASLFISVLILFILFLFGSVLSSAMGKYSAFLLERNALLKIIRQRRRQERAASKAYRAQLEQFMKEQERIQQEDAMHAAAAAGANTEESEAQEGGSPRNVEEAAAAVEEEILCVICYVRQVDVAVGPCGHVAVCRFCCQRLRECPVCRETVKSVYALPPYLVRRLAEQRRTEDGGGDSSTPGVAAAIVAAALDAASASASILRQGGASVENMQSLPVGSTPETQREEKKNSSKYERLPSVGECIPTDIKELEEQREAERAAAPGSNVIELGITEVHMDT